MDLGLALTHGPKGSVDLGLRVTHNAYFSLLTEKKSFQCIVAMTTLLNKVLLLWVLFTKKTITVASGLEKH